MAAETYPIKPDCPAPRHNTLNAARGVKSKSSSGRRINGRQVSGFPPCICDHAVELNKAFMTKRRARYGARKSAPADPAKVLANAERTRRNAILNNLAAMSATRRGVETPDLAAGECRTLRGMVTMDNYVDWPQSEGRVGAARGVCGACRLSVACEAWVIAAEQPAGSWGGMYAGMTPQNRRDRALAAYENQQAEQLLREERSAPRESAA